ncbi:HNH endonuclease domain-containing protein [Chryseomicrobium palamuruense]|uniref:HNH endonuclease domain-containing protein n=1 Tax=Chryseomicrobium palamuruense TaxID=682973 RepID=A0ABV8UW79_9BACL
MAAGWQLSEGRMSYKSASDDEYFAAVTKALSNQSSKTTSYKFGFLRAILENLYQNDAELKLNYSQLAHSMAKLYWNLVIEYEYQQGHRSQIVSILTNFKNTYGIPSKVSYDVINPLTQAALEKEITNKILKKYVVGALFEDTNKILYSFSKKEGLIRFSDASLHFLRKYQTTIFKLTTYELTKYIQIQNPLVDHQILIESIENITKRSSLLQFQKELIQLTGAKCFYTETHLHSSKRSIAVDHFIPWSFIHSDDLWNLVLTSQSLNSKKGSKLPDKNFLNKLHSRNVLLKQSEDIHVRLAFEGYHFQIVRDLYQYADVNGFEIGWKA